jgi:hypothetical protein
MRVMGNAYIISDGNPKWMIHLNFKTLKSYDYDNTIMNYKEVD